MEKKKMKKHQINLSFSFPLLNHKLIWGPDQNYYCSNAIEFVQNLFKILQMNTGIARLKRAEEKKLILASSPWLSG